MTALSLARPSRCSLALKLPGAVLLAAVNFALYAGPPPDARGLYVGEGRETASNCRDPQRNYTIPSSVTINIPGQTGALLIGSGLLSGTVRDNAKLNGLALQEATTFYGSVDPAGQFFLDGEAVKTGAGRTSSGPLENTTAVFLNRNIIANSHVYVDAPTSCLVNFSYSVVRQGLERLPLGVQYSDLGDNDGDSKADLVLRHAKSGNVVAWRMDGTSILSAASVANANPIWELQGIGDINGDGRADYIWRHATNGSVVAWLMNGTTLLTGSVVATADAALNLQAVDDFNGDGRDDLLWRSSLNGAMSIWFMDGANVLSAGSLASIPPLNVSVVGVGDLNADGRADIVLRANNSTVSAMLLDGLSTVAEGPLPIASTPIDQNDPTWDIQGVGDINGDGKSDIFWRRSTGEVGATVLDGLTTATSTVIATISPTWRVQGVGDLNGDNRADIILRSGINVHAWMMNGPAIVGGGPLATINPGWLVE